MPMFREQREQGCSFCGRTAEQARGIVAGDGVGICDECVALAHGLLLERGVAPARGRDERSPRDRSTNWLISAQGVEPDDGAVLIDLTAELDLEVEPDVEANGATDLRWPEVGRFPAP